MKRRWNRQTGSVRVLVLWGLTAVALLGYFSCESISAARSKERNEPLASAQGGQTFGKTQGAR